MDKRNDMDVVSFSDDESNPSQIIEDQGMVKTLLVHRLLIQITAQYLSKSASNHIFYNL